MALRKGGVAMGVMAIIGGLFGCRAGLKTDVAPADRVFGEGITYYLPRTELKVSATLGLYRTRVWTLEPLAAWWKDGKPTVRTVCGNDKGQPRLFRADGVEMAATDDLDRACKLGASFVLIDPQDGAAKGEEWDVTPTESPTVTPETVADSRLRCVVPPDELRNFAVAVKDAKLVLKENGLLTSVDATFEDKTAQVIGSVVKVAITAAKFAAAMAEAKSPPAALPAGRVRYRELVASIPIEYRVRMSEFEVERVGDGYVHTWNSDFKSMPEFGSATETERLWSQYNRTDQPHPEIAESRLRISFEATSDMRELSLLDLAQLGELASWPGAKDDDSRLNGILFRSAEPVQLGVFVNGQATGVRPAVFAGCFGLAKIQSEPFTDSKYGLTMADSTGCLKQFEFTGSASGEAISKMLETNSEAVRTGMTDVETAAMQRETARLKAEADLLDQKKRLKELEAYK